LDQSAWDGNTVDLQLADAWSSCSLVADSTFIDTSLFKDGYLDAVLRKMQKIIPWWPPACVDFPPDTPSWFDMGDLERWYYFRSSAACNRDPSTGLERAAEMPQNKIDLAIELPFPKSWLWAAPLQYAERDLRLPAVNHCIAMRLRQAAPGAMGGEALLLSSADQRQLLAEQKNRSQLAAVGYAQLLTVFAAPEANALPVWLSEDQRIPLLQWWSRDPSNKAALQRMQEDFAAAIQLHIVTSRELAELLARSASARQPRGGSAQNRGEEEWGPGSFRARTMASFYGGDPLAEEQDGVPPTPWSHPFGKQSPGWTDTGLGILQWPWPDAEESPFVTAALGGPKPSFFLGLARTADALLLALSHTPETACGSVVEATTARRMMRAVEADLRTRTCFECLATGPGPEPGTEICTDCTVFGVDDVADAELDNPESLVVWQRHRLSLDDAEKAVSLLGDFVNPVCVGGPPEVRPGAQLVAGELSVENPDGPWLRISKDAVFRDPKWVERVTPYTALAPWRMPPWYSVLPAQGASYQGFPPLGDGTGVSWPEEAKRVMGSISALAAIRDSIVSIDLRLADTPHPNLGNRLGLSERVAALIAAAIGERSVSVRPTVVASGDAISVKNAANGAPQWEVTIIAPLDDRFWDSAPDNYDIGVVKNDRWAQRLASDPDAVLFGRKQSDLQSDASWFSFAGSEPWPTTNPVSRRWTAYVSLPSSLTTGVSWWTFVVRKNNLVKAPPEFGLVAGSMQLWPTEAMHGQYLAGGGQLGGFSRRSVAKRSDEPSMAAYDGFGLPTTWIPPTDPALFGSDGQSAVSHYLGRARFAATEATDAVSGAMESLLEQQQDEAASTAARAMASKVAELETRALCGDGNPSCDVSPVPWSPDLDVPTIDCNGALTWEEILDCHAKAMLAPLSQLTLAKPVKARITDPTPSFPEFEGGELQGALIEQWRAGRKLEGLAAELNRSLSDAKTLAQLLAVDFAQHGRLIEINCGAEAMADAVEAGRACSHPPAQGDFDPAPGYCVASETDGPLIAAHIKCRELAAQFPSLLAGAIAKQEAAFNDVVAFSTQLSDAVAALLQASATLSQLRQESALATEQAAMEAELTAATRTTVFGLYRSYHNYDLWRAKAMLESARRYSVAARRTIEARYVVDLSSLNADESFVASPASWADEVYNYDLSLPSAVGLSVSTGDESAGIYPNKVSDYVGNLEKFVEGFAIERPTTSSLEDREVFALPGLEWTPCDPFDDLCAGGGPVDEASNAWSFFCPNTGAWAQLPPTGNGAEACGDVRPTQARILFSLDPWGRVGMDIAHEPFAQRYNARWTRLVVNLVGTGIKDCANATEPSTCYSQPFIRYNLSHVGPAWVTDHEGRWKALGFDKGRIEGAKALATESWLDPVSDSWSDTQIDAVMRGELRDRPLGGTYELVLEVPPELDLSHLEMVQVMMGNAYWVKQQ